MVAGKVANATARCIEKYVEALEDLVREIRICVDPSLQCNYSISHPDRIIIECLNSLCDLNKIYKYSIKTEVLKIDTVRWVHKKIRKLGLTINKKALNDLITTIDKLIEIKRNSSTDILTRCLSIDVYTLSKLNKTLDTLRNLTNIIVGYRQK